MNISQRYRSAALATDEIEVVVTVPTYKRPKQLLDTLSSLENQSATQSLAVIVMDNDAQGEGAEAASNFLKSSKLEGLVILAHDRGNCHAYNAGWRTALEEFAGFKWLAVIDDDEIADRDWLKNHIETAHQSHADFVGGPQVQIFDKGAAPVWHRHPVFEPHYEQTGSVPILYSSGNVIISRKVLETMPHPHLDIQFNFTGGGDSDFYARAKEKGFTFAWCQEAPVSEDVPPQRATFKWVNARSLRNGSISAMIDAKANGGWTKTNFKTLALLIAAPVRSIKLSIEKRSLTIGIYHMQVAIGRMLALFGIVNEQYRNAEKN